MQKANFRLSIRVDRDKPVFDPSACFHIYFPTEEPTGFGFSVHGDFFVKPDRTRLMPGAYNEWLLGLCAKKLVNEFLTRCLDRFDPKALFESLAPSNAISHQVAKRFRESVGKALRGREAPFLPSRIGLLKREEIALPSSVDSDGFWISKFSESLLPVVGKREFISPLADSDAARRFLEFAAVTPLEHDRILDLIEHAAEGRQSADWWYEIYSYLAAQPGVTWRHDDLVGRKIVPVQNLEVVEVPTGPHPVLCFPPTDDASTPTVPSCFTTSFVFLNSEFSKKLHAADDYISHWAASECRIVRFEATELLPRAIAANVNSFFDGKTAFTPSHLALLWTFVERIIALSRDIKSEHFWQQIGRLPLPSTIEPQIDKPIPPSTFVPAFLCYWEDGDPGCTESIIGIKEYPRLSKEFPAYLARQSKVAESNWRLLLSNAGVSGAPKRLTYVRSVGQREAAFDGTIGDELVLGGFTGDRQRDENLVVLKNLKNNTHWQSHVDSFPPEQRRRRTLQEVTIIDRLHLCIQAADNAPDCQRRLWALIRNMPVRSVSDLANDKVFQRAGSRFGGSNVPIRSFLQAQIRHLRWAPSSFGPVSPLEGFLRLATRRFVSKGASRDELGDLLVPYVVAEQLGDYQRLMQLGFSTLEEEPESAAVLIRFLKAAGQRLSEDWAKDKILGVRSRWRLVRGALQDSYRILNQMVTNELRSVPPIADDTKFGARISGKVEFRSRPLFYVDPGSPIERAFIDTLPFFDTDRVYRSLFEKLGIRQLISGQSVDEELCEERRAAPSSALRDAIVNELSPYLLAIVIAKSESKEHGDLILRRLKERFDVYCIDRLAIKYTLRSYDGLGPIERKVEFSKFYLQRKLVELEGAVKETHYSLYVVGPDNTALEHLDGDALGDTLSPIFFDGVSDLAALLPRAVSRFQLVHGNQNAMKQFLLEGLGVSVESQEFAHDDVAGRSDIYTTLEAPPGATIIQPAADSDNQELNRDPHETSKLLGGLAQDLAHKIAPSSQGGSAASPSFGSNLSAPTREQEVRGRKGEEEFFRRTKLPGGWMGFVFEKDCRFVNAGYDFFCRFHGEEARVEVKTFAANGRVVITANELKAASEHRNTFYLVGFIDDDGPENRWQSYVLQDPLPQLFRVGKFSLDVELQASANEIFR